MIKNKAIVLILGLTVSFTLTGCIPKDEGNRKVIDKQGKTITVIENSDNPQIDEEPSLQKIEKLEGIRAMDWLSEDTILVSKENTSLEKIQMEEGTAYPKNLYYYDLNSEETRVIREDSSFQGFAVFSPDKKHIFFKKSIEETATAYIMDSDGQKETNATQNDHHVNIYGGRWIDNERVIYPSNTGSIFVADVNGKVSEIGKVDSKYIHDVAKIGDKIYYNTIDRNLMVLDLISNEKKVIMDNIVWMIPSPDNSQFALVRRTGETKMELVLAGLEGNVKKTLAEGTQIFGTSWSPDQSMLAFSIMSEDGAENGLYVSDLRTDKTTQLSVNMKYLSDPVRWSPSGKKLAASEMVTEGNTYKPVTYAITLK